MIQVETDFATGRACRKTISMMSQKSLSSPWVFAIQEPETLEIYLHVRNVRNSGMNNY